MLSNYLKVAARNWKERPLFAAINLIGLAVSFAAVLLIIQHVQFERSFDQFHNHASSIYRIGEKSATSSSASISKYLTRVPVLPALSSTYPDVESGTRVFDEYLTVQFEDRAFREEITFVDSTFFNVFSFPIKGGRADQVLSEKRNVVVTTSIAQKYFGNQNPVGQAITIDHSERYVISGVVDDPPPNSSIRFDILVPFANARDREPVKSNGTWANSFMPTYVRLGDGVSGASFESKLSPFVQSHFPDDDQDYALHLMPLTQLHAATTGNSLFLYILLCAGVVILIIAGINYTNLATAQSMIRAQEVGIRRALGAHRSQLAWQFVGESVLTSLAGLLLGVGLAHLATPLLGSWIGVEWSLNLIGEWQKSGLLFLLALGFGLAAGLYPAMYLASNEFARSGGSAPQSQGGLRLRQGLITLQLTFSVVLIIGTFTIWGQIDFMENQDLGFTDAPVYIVQFDKDEYADPDRFTRKVATLRSVLQQEPGIAETSLSSSVPGNYTEFYQQFYPVDAPTRKATRLRWTMVDSTFFQTFDINVAAGRDFGTHARSVDNPVIINQAAADALGLTEPVGSQIRYGAEDGSRLTVIGVTGNFHVQSLKSEIDPIIHFYIQDRIPSSGFLSLRLYPNRIDDARATVEKHWKRIDASRPPSTFFVHRHFAEQYDAQKQRGSLAAGFSSIALLVAAMGLFGIASMSVVQRRKEIGVRKSMGASSLEIVRLFLVDFSKLVGVAFLIGAPAGYLLAWEWVQDFAYHTEIGVGLLVLSGLSILLFTWMSIAYQTHQAASINPASTLHEAR